MISLHHVVQSTPQLLGQSFASLAVSKPDGQVVSSSIYTDPQGNRIINERANDRSTRSVALPITILIPPPLPGEKKTVYQATTALPTSLVNRVTPPVTKTPVTEVVTTRIAAAPTTKLSLSPVNRGTTSTTIRVTAPVTSQITPAPTTRPTSPLATRATSPSPSRTTKLLVKRPTVPSGTKKLTGNRNDGSYVHDNRGVYKADSRGKYRQSYNVKKVQKLL